MKKWLVVPRTPVRDVQGFTLVEVLVAMVIAGIIIGVISTSYTVQQRTHTAQTQVTEMQQNIRAALNMIMKDVRMAGYDPTDSKKFGIKEIAKGRYRFTQDLDEDGNDTGPNEDVTYGFSAANDSKEDGVADNGVASLGRDTGGGFEPIAENIQAIEFRYLDTDGNVTTDVDKVRFVDISILARAGLPDPNFFNTATYFSASGLVTNTPWDLNGDDAGTANPPNDNFRRRLIITRVQCRNMGLME